MVTNPFQGKDATSIKGLAVGTVVDGEYLKRNGSTIDTGSPGGGGTPATTVEAETSFGVSSAVGTGTKYARDDHTHGTPTDPVTAHTALDTGVHGVGASTVDSVSARDSAISTHAAAADPHTGYQKESEKSAANGYASLGAGGLVPISELASGTPDGTKFIRDDGTLQTPAGGGSFTLFDDRAINLLANIGNFQNWVGSGSGNDQGGYAYRITSGATSGNISGKIWMFKAEGQTATWALFDKNPQAEFLVILESVTSVTHYFVIGTSPSDGESSQDWFGFKVVNGALYATTHSGTNSEETTDLSTTLSANTMYRLKIKLVSGTNVTSWVDGVSKSAHSPTYLPGGNTDGFGTDRCFCAMEVKTTATGAKNLTILDSLLVCDW